MKLKKVYCVVSFFALSVVLSACGDQQASNNKQVVSEAPQQAPVQMAAPATQPPQAPGMIQGKVLETFGSGGYTYLKLDCDGKETWAAVPQSDVNVGDDVSLPGGQVMNNFHSKTLDRTFDEIVFCGAILGKGQEGGAPMAATGDSFGAALQSESAAVMGQQFDPSQLSMGSSKAVVPFSELKIDKAAGENSFTVGELFGKAAELSGNTVRVKAQVVKFTANIMGKNWLHLQDGTGDPQQSTHDLVVTSDQQAEKGDVVTVEGVLAANKDFGYGYKYNVIVEDVKVIR